jgi:O-antigen ligase
VMAGMAAAPAASRRPTRIPWWSVLLMIVVFYPPVLKPFGWLTGQAPWDVSIDRVTEGDAMREVLLTFLGLVAIGRLVFRRTGRSTRVAPNTLGWLLVVFAVLILASVLWSDEPALAFRRRVAFGMIWLAAFAYRRMPGEEFLRLVFFTTLAALAFGVAKEVAHGTFHPWDPSYRFLGTLPTPNVQGLNCALVCLSGLSLVHALRRWGPALAQLFPLVCLFLTRSRTSVAALIGAALFYAFLALLRRRPVALAASLSLAAMVVVSVAWLGLSSPVVGTALKLGREHADVETLQGRTLVWEEARAFVRARPWLGYGHDAFWSRTRMEEFTRAVDWPIANAHSNYLDVLLGLGGIGLFVFVCILGIGMSRASKLAVGSGNPADLFIAALLAFCAVHSFLETTLIGPCFLSFLYLTSLVRLGFSNQALVAGARVY